MKNESKITEKENKKQKPILTEEELKHKKVKKTRGIVAVFVLILSVGIMGNWYVQNSDLSQNIQPLINNSGVKTLGEAEFVDAQTELTTQTENEYFSKARMDRQSARDKQLEVVKESIEKTNDKDAISIAEEKISKISSYIGIENKIETLVIAKGVTNCLAVVNDDGTMVDIIVECEELSDSLIMQIKDIAIEQLNCEFKNVSIIQIKE